MEETRMQPEETQMTKPLLVVLVSLVLGLPTSDAFAQDFHGRGVICNWSSESIIVTAKDPEWEVLWYDPGVCSNALFTDVDALWGRQCSANGDCWYQTWKLGDGFFWVTDHLDSPIPPGIILLINGEGSESDWFRASDWPAPPLESIGYELSR